MTQCKCEHWQQCPVCMPHRFDAEGKLLPPEPTPLQSARTRIAELEAIIEAQRTLYANASKIANESDELRRQQAVLVEALEEAKASFVWIGD